MNEVRMWECPFYHRCFDLHLIAMRAFRDEDLVKEADRDALDQMCEKCRNYEK